MQFTQSTLLITIACAFALMSQVKAGGDFGDQFTDPFVKLAEGTADFVEDVTSCSDGEACEDLGF